MGKVLVALAIIFFTAALLYGSIVAYTIGKQHRFLDITPAPPVPSPPPNAIEQQLPTPTIFQGKIISISLHPIAYKNSTIITVLKQDNTKAQVYINTQTVLTDINNQKVDLPQLTTGMNISLKGRPIDAGIEASKITVLNTIQ